MIVRTELLIHPSHDYLYAKVVDAQTGASVLEQRLARGAHTRREHEDAGWKLANELLETYRRRHREQTQKQAQRSLFGESD